MLPLGTQAPDFRLPDTGVSRRHLEITWDTQSAMLADLGSTNGTTVQGQPVQTWQLADGDVIRIVLGEAAWLAACGVGLGVAGALGATRLIQTLLFGVTPTDAARNFL